MAGPCSVESEEQIVEVGLKAVKNSGANFLRGGALSQEHHLIVSKVLNLKD